MPNSISSARTSNSAVAEWLLAHIAGPTRAAAILGDLTEMSATHGRLWFWTAYGRTIVELGWRIPFSFVFGCATFCLTYWFSHSKLMLVLRPSRHEQPSMLAMSHHIWFLALWVFVSEVTLLLWFVVPFAVARYGVHDRFVRLALLLALPMTCALVYPHPVTLLFVAITLCAIAASLFSKQWRKTVFAFAGTVVTGTVAYMGVLQTVALGFWYFGQEQHRHPFDGLFAAPHRTFWIAMWAIALWSMFIVASVCTRLHRWLVRDHPTAGTTLAEPQ